MFSPTVTKHWYVDVAHAPMSGETDTAIIDPTLGNAPSIALARRAGLELLGDWQVIIAN